jgi:DNA segregation ATPase FtsK/SpoIIIE, S-DNA-T family
VFLLLFGGPSFLFPVMLGYAGFLLFRPPGGETPSRTTLGFRAFGFVLTLATSAGIATLHFTGTAYPNSAGGILGDLVGNGLSHAFSFLGATLLLLALWFAGVSLFLGVSWLTIMDWIGHQLFAGHAWIKASLAERKDRSVGREAKEVRKEAIREEKKKAEFKPPPRIEVPKPVIEKSERVEKEKQVPLFDRPQSKELPALKLLDDPPPREQGYSAEALEAMSRLVELKLRDFGVEVEVVAVHPGPVVTRFELRPAPGVKVSQISGLSKDIARALSAISVRIVEVIPGKSVIGLEIPNEKREIVTLGEIIKSKTYDDVASPLALALGKDIGGQPGGRRPAEDAAPADRRHDRLRQVRRHQRDGAVAALQGAGRPGPPDHGRPEDAGALGVRGHPAPARAGRHRHEAGRQRAALVRRRDGAALHADGGARRAEHRRLQQEDQGSERLGQADPGPDPRAAAAAGRRQPARLDGNVPNCEPLPYIVVVIDELADLMMIVGKKVEELIARLAQKARASGIHLILATQRPSVDVITGPDQGEHPDADRVPGVREGRLAHDPRPDRRRALLGHGDMLYLPPGTSCRTACTARSSRTRRCTGWSSSLRNATPNYIEEILEGPRGPIPGLPSEGGETAVRTERMPNGCALRRSGTDRAGDAQGLRLRHPAPPQDRLQPRRTPRRDDGSGRTGRSPAAERLPRDPRPGACRWLSAAAASSCALPAGCCWRPVRS